MTGKIVYLVKCRSGQSLVSAAESAKSGLINRLIGYGVQFEESDIVVNVSEVVNAAKATVRNVEIPSGVRLSLECDDLVEGLNFFETGVE